MIHLTPPPHTIKAHFTQIRIGQISKNQGESLLEEGTHSPQTEVGFKIFRQSLG